MMDIAIVGGGCSALLLLLNLVPQLTQRNKILLFSDELKFGRGIAYGTECELHLLNVPAGNMSAYPDQPQHFLHFCQSRDPSISANSFVPRKLYGDYLEDCLAQLLQRYPNSVQRIHARVTAIRPYAEGFYLTTHTGASYSAAETVL